MSKYFRYFDTHDFQATIEACKSKAIADKLDPTEDSIYRSYCREYSMLFSTPLKEVNEMDPKDVLLPIMEHHLEDADPLQNLEELLEQIYFLEDPEYAKEKLSELKAFIKEAEEEEERRIAEGRPIHKDLADEVTLNPVAKTPPTPPKNLPQSGGINLAYLEKEETGNNDEEF
jgi:hypothetical protein